MFQLLITNNSFLILTKQLKLQYFDEIVKLKMYLKSKNI